MLRENFHKTWNAYIQRTKDAIQNKQVVLDAVTQERHCFKIEPMENFLCTEHFWITNHTLVYFGGSFYKSNSQKVPSLNLKYCGTDQSGPQVLNQKSVVSQAGVFPLSYIPNWVTGSTKCCLQILHSQYFQLGSICNLYESYLVPCTTGSIYL